MPTDAETKFCTVSPVICTRWPITVSGTYDCQFVLVTNEIAVLNAIPRFDRAPVQAQREQPLQALQEIEEHDGEEREGEQRGGVAGPPLLGVRVHPDHAVHGAFDPPVPAVGVDDGQVVAERHVDRGEEQHQGTELHDPGGGRGHQNFSGRMRATNR